MMHNILAVWESRSVDMIERLPVALESLSSSGYESRELVPNLMSMRIDLIVGGQ